MASRPSLSTLLLLLAACAIFIVSGSLDPTTDAVACKEHVLRTHMSTKTMYPAPTASQLADEYDAQLSNSSNNPNAKTNESNTCHPIQLNFVVRHGTRFPTIKDIDRISATHAKLRTRVAFLPERLRHSQWATHDWRNPYDPTRAGWLAGAGVMEQISLGKRLRARFLRPASDDASPLQFHADAFVVQHTYKPRTLQSAMGFAYGFFNGVQPVHYAADPMGHDHALRFFANCQAFDHAIEHNVTATRHHKGYQRSRQMQRNLRKFQQTAGDPNGSLFTQKDLEAAYAGCAFDVAVRNEFSEWCALLDDETLLSMDYYHDLKHFYKKSHGNALAWEIAAPLLQDMYHAMRARADGHSRVQGHFRFAHAETILPLASLLNLSYFDRHASDRDGHFMADTPLAIARKRSFRGSVLAPFSANIGFVLYECGRDHQQTPTFRVQTLLHERTVRFPDCGDEALCPLETFENMFRQWIHEYDYFSQCAVE